MPPKARRANSPIPSRAAATKALRRLAQRGLVLYTELEAPLRRAVLVYWGSMAETRKALGLREPAAPRQAWSRERVIREIRKLHRAGEHLSSSALMSSGRGDLVTAAINYAGGWVRARALAGVNFKAHRVFTLPTWDATTIVAEIKARHRQGLPLALTKTPNSLRCAARRVFGSWRKAIAAAGLDYDSILLLRQRSDDELLAWLRQLARKKPRMSLFDLDKHGGHTVACRRRWGSLEAAAAAAGIVGWPIRLRAPAMSRAAVIRALRKRRKDGLPIQLSAVRHVDGGHHLINSAFHHFKSWSSATAASR